MDRAGINRSVWMRGPSAPAYPALSGDTRVDVAVVGAGITGLTAALRLRELGRSVAVIEMNRVGSGTTGSSTGHLDSHTDQTYGGLLRTLGRDGARRFVRLKRQAVDHVLQWDRELRLGCNARRLPGYLYCETDGDTGRLKREYAAARELDVDVEMRAAAPLPFANALALVFPEQGCFDPLRYVQGLARVLVDSGGLLFENTRAEQIAEENGEGRIRTGGGGVTAGEIVLAGHVPLLGMLSAESRALAYQSYVLGARVADEVPDALYWDTAVPYHYTRHANGDDLLIIGGADHRTGTRMDTNASFDALGEYIGQRYHVRSVEARWSHEFVETVDGLPWIGRVPGFERIAMGAGYSGDGLTLGTAAGLILADLAAGRENPAAGLFDPARIKPGSRVGRLTGNLLHMARHFVGDRVMGTDYAGVEEIAPGEGGLVNVEGERTAVYRDERGEVHMMSPVCRHMGCYVHWNSAERTWDCPCHGGRYDAHGNVIMGPPKQSLEMKVPAGRS